jgi:hypothetical protein
MTANQKRPRQWPPIEPVLPREGKVPPTGLPRPTDLSVSEPEHRSFWIILAAILFFALAAGGGYYWLNRPEPGPVAMHIVPASSAPSDSVSARSDAPPVQPTPQLVTGLRPLSSQPTEQPASAPEAPQPAAGSEPDQPQPQLATGLRPKTEQEQSPAPMPPAEAAPPAEPPPAAIPNAKPSRKAAHHGSSPGAPQQPSSGPVKF